MGFNFGMNSMNTTGNKAGLTKTIKTKQAMFNRFKRRFNASKNPTEKRFLKTEAVRICNELKMCSKVWKNCGFGSNVWVTRNYTTSCFTMTKTGSRKTSSRKHYGKTTSRYGRSNARRSSSRSNSARKSYVAW